ncbi:SET domain protein, putative [Plasmodium ovale]|uniref:SET domain protein, putative n=1 Tax=Plasmodium ovale TaxID=36330 RepID=A0A1C3KQC2_PLAOA|nr:SET domain protein, putative [Plasmodium ovale]
MSKLSTILENEKEIRFCSCVIKLQGKPSEKNMNTFNEKRPKVWLDYFNDIVKDDLMDIHVRKLHVLKNNIGAYMFPLKNKNSNVLLYNPFDINLRTQVKGKKGKFLHSEKRKNSTYLCKEKKNKLTFDDLVWNNKLKKYMPAHPHVQNVKYSQNAKGVMKGQTDNSEARDSRDKHCLPLCNDAKGLTFNGTLKTSPLRSKGCCKNGNWRLKLRGKENQCGNEKIYVNECPPGVSKSQGQKEGRNEEHNKGENIGETKRTYYNAADITKRIFESNVEETGEQLKREILLQSENIKNFLMQQKEDNILKIQDEKSGRAKIVSNRKIEIGQVIFIEESFLETSILLNDLWETFNSLNEEQKKALDYINEFINMGTKEKIKEAQHISEEIMKNRVNTSSFTNANEEKHNDAKNYDPRCEMEEPRLDEADGGDTLREHLFKPVQMHSWENKEEVFSRGNAFIHSLMKFETFTDILKNAFISPGDKKKIMLFRDASFLKHSCFPNASYCLMGNRKICFLAMRTINMYDEITISAINELYASIEYRKSKLYEVKSVTCSCNRCLQIIDEERHILCSVCKYSYVSKKINEKYVAAMKHKKQLYSEQTGGDTTLVNAQPGGVPDDLDLGTDKVCTFPRGIQDKLEHYSVHSNGWKPREKSDHFLPHSFENSKVNGSAGKNAQGVRTGTRFDNNSDSSICSGNVTQRNGVRSSEEMHADPVNPKICYSRAISRNPYSEWRGENREDEGSSEHMKTLHAKLTCERGGAISFGSPSFLHHDKDESLDVTLLGSSPFSKYQKGEDLDAHYSAVGMGTTRCYTKQGDDRKEAPSTSCVMCNVGSERCHLKKIKNVSKNCNCGDVHSSDGMENVKNTLSKQEKGKSTRSDIKEETCAEEEEKMTNLGRSITCAELFHIYTFEKSIDLDNNLENILNMQNMEENIGYCKFRNDKKWICERCQECISEFSMPLESERYFIQEYIIIKEKKNDIRSKIHMESIINKIEKSLLYIMAILGQKHWLYAAFNLLIADIGFSFYSYDSLSLNNKYLLKIFQAFNNFVYFIQMKCPYSIHTDLVPIVLRFLIISIKTCNYKTFYEFSRSGFLELIKQKYGIWDVSYLSLLYAFKMCYQLSSTGTIPNKKSLLILTGLAQENILRSHMC